MWHSQVPSTALLEGAPRGLTREWLSLVGGHAHEDFQSPAVGKGFRVIVIDMASSSHGLAADCEAVQLMVYRGIEAILA